MIRSKALYFLLLFVLLQTNLSSFAQPTSFPINEWVKTLSAKDDIENSELGKIWSAIQNEDSAVVYNCFKQMESTGASTTYFKARLSYMKADEAFRLGADIITLKQLCDRALHDAYETGDNYLIAGVSGVDGEIMQSRGETELSAAYYLEVIDILAPLEQKPSFYNIYQFNLGEMVYHTRDYEKCIEYTREGLANYTDTSRDANYQRIRYWNTIGQAYYKLGQPDSAMINYQRSMQLANKLNDSVWRGINHVNIAEVYFLKKDYAKAKELIESDYKLKYTPEPNVFAYGLQLLAKVNLLQGDNDSALQHIRQALQVLNGSHDFPMQKIDYLQYAYYTASDVYRALGNTDSFYHYSNLYDQLHDSLERVVTLSSMKLAQLRIDNEKNYRTIRQLKAQEETETLMRNFIIAFLVMASVIAILVLNRQRQRSKYKEQLALQQKAVAEANTAVADAERVAAKEQLNLFTQNLIEKTILIEKLEQQVKANEYNIQQPVIEELTRQAILTEDDWLKFKMLFDKSFPGFFTKLKEKSNDITQAEQRMAALTRLHLTTKQMAALLGISPNSVNKTKQRLRQRFSFENDFHVEDLLSKL